MRIGQIENGIVLDHITAGNSMNIYNTFYDRTGYEGVGQAKAVIFFIIVAVISLLQLWFTRRKEVET